MLKHNHTGTIITLTHLFTYLFEWKSNSESKYHTDITGSNHSTTAYNGKTEMNIILLLLLWLLMVRIISMIQLNKK